MKLCVIPARGGSKRIPRKNIRIFSGKPIISWSIQAALSSDCFDQIIVSTDDDMIADAARKYGAQVPFIRPKKLADDFTGTMSVVEHAVHWYLDQGQEIEAVCCLYATAPFVTAADLKKGLSLLDQSLHNRFVFSATSYATPIQRALTIDPSSGLAQMCQPEHFSTRSQDLQPVYHDAGQFYWGSSQAWINSSQLFEGSRPLILPRWRVLDIDTEEDWTHAQLIHECLVNSSMLS